MGNLLMLLNKAILNKLLNKGLFYMCILYELYLKGSFYWCSFYKAILQRLIQ